MNEGVDSVEGFEVVGVDGEEANEGEKRAPEFGPVVCCDSLLMVTIHDVGRKGQLTQAYSCFAEECDEA